MSDDREEIGTVAPTSHEGMWRARCTKPRCAWAVADTRDEVERRLRRHATLVHPPTITIYRA